MLEAAPATRGWRFCVAVAGLITLAVTPACNKNDMAYQVSIRPGSTADAPPPESVPMSGREPELVDDEVIDALSNPVPGSEESIGAGRRLYSDHCAPCHGNDGRGDGALTEELGELESLSEFVGPDVSDGYLYNLIRHGGISMPGYGADLSIQERWELINFIRTFARVDDD